MARFTGGQTPGAVRHQRKVFKPWRKSKSGHKMSKK